MLAFCEAEQRPDALGKKRFGKDELATMRAMTTTGSAEALFTRVEPMHSVITPKMRGSVSLTRFGMNPEKRVPASPPTKRAQLSVIGPIIILNLLK